MTKKETEKRIEAYLQRTGRKVTKERLTVLDFILQEEESFTASDICASSADGEISQATVYNTINYLLRCSILERVPTTDPYSRYRLNEKILNDLSS